MIILSFEEFSTAIADYRRVSLGIIRPSELFLKNKISTIIIITIIIILLLIITTK